MVNKRLVRISAFEIADGELKLAFSPHEMSSEQDARLIAVHLAEMLRHHTAYLLAARG